MTSIFCRFFVFPSKVLHTRPSPPILKGWGLHPPSTNRRCRISIKLQSTSTTTLCQKRAGEPQTLKLKKKKIQIRFDNCPGAAGASRVAVNCKLIRVPIFRKIVSDKRNFSSLLIVSSYIVSKLQTVICLVLFHFFFCYYFHIRWNPAPFTSSCQLSSRFFEKFFAQRLLARLVIVINFFFLDVICSPHSKRLWLSHEVAEWAETGRRLEKR